MPNYTSPISPVKHCSEANNKLTDHELCVAVRQSVSDELFVF